MKSSLETLSDLLGLIAASLMVVPFYSDFVSRRLRAWYQHHQIDPGLAAPFKRKVLDTVSTLSEQIDAPKQRDFVLNTLGMTLLVASFALKLFVP